MSIKKAIVAIGMFSVVVFTFAPFVFAGKDDFLPDNLLSGLEKELNLAEEKISAIAPVIEKESKNLLETIDKNVAKGFLEFQSLSKEVDGVIDTTKKELDQYLSSEEFKQLETFWDKLNNDTVGTIRDLLVDELAKRLDLSSDQIKKAYPILKEDMMKQGELLKQVLDQGTMSFQEFKQEDATLWQETKKRLGTVLTPQQLKEFDKWQQDVLGEIDKSIPSEKK